ncbi:MAG TPA: TatD family hydrolase [Kofleriaceae bacterium]|jgi:TatD DNase family protein
MIDTHCHLDVEAFDVDRAGVLARAVAAGVRGIVVPAIRLRPRPIDHPLVRIALGVHPQIVPELDARERALDPERLAADAIAAGACAIGECGLDGGTAERELQEELFRVQIRAARIAKLPLVVHVLRAHDAAPKVLREELARDVGGVLHSYSGGAELVASYARAGFAFSFAGPITYPNARKPIEAARAVPAELLLAETDAPDQVPANHRGERSEPAFVADVLAGLSAARGEDVSAVCEANALRIFGPWV